MNNVCFQALHVKREVHDSNISCLGVIWACGLVSACYSLLSCFCHLLPKKQLRGQFNLVMQLPWIQVWAGLCTERKMLPFPYYCSGTKMCGQSLVSWFLEGASVKYKLHFSGQEGWYVSCLAEMLRVRCLQGLLSLTPDSIDCGENNQG